MSLVPKKVVLQIHLRSRALIIIIIIIFLLLSTQVPPLDLICHEVQLSCDLAFTVYLAKSFVTNQGQICGMEFDTEFLASNFGARFLFFSLVLHEVQNDIQ